MSIETLLAEMRAISDDASLLGEFRRADGTVNYEAVNRFARATLHIHGGTEPGAGIAVFPLSYAALTMLTPEEREHAYELAWPVEQQIAWSHAHTEERPLPEARPATPAPEPPTPDEPRGMLARVLRRSLRF